MYLYAPNTTQKSNCRKLARKWVGPYVIVEMIRGVNVKIQNLENNKVVPTLIYVNRLKRAYDRSVRPSDTLVTVDRNEAGKLNLDEECSQQRILSFPGRHRRIHLLCGVSCRLWLLIPG